MVFYVFNHNNTRDSDVKLYVKFCHSDTKKFSFSYRTTNFWNALSSLTKKAKTLDHFKILLDNDDNKLINCFDYDQLYLAPDRAGIVRHNEGALKGREAYACQAALDTNCNCNCKTDRKGVLGAF